MTVQVTRSDGGTDEFARFGDRFAKHGDGSLEIIRVGAAQPTTRTQQAFGPRSAATKSASITVGFAAAPDLSYPSRREPSVRLALSPRGNQTHSRPSVILRSALSGYNFRKHSKQIFLVVTAARTHPAIA